MSADPAEQLRLVRSELELLNKLLLEESLMGFPDAERRERLSRRRQELKASERELLEKIAQS